MTLLVGTECNADYSSWRQQSKRSNISLQVSNSLWDRVSGQTSMDCKVCSCSSSNRIICDVMRNIAALLNCYVIHTGACRNGRYRDDDAIYVWKNYQANSSSLIQDVMVSPTCWSLAAATDCSNRRDQWWTSVGCRSGDPSLMGVSLREWTYGALWLIALGALEILFILLIIIIITNK